jgi:hypothetical protein
MYATVFKKAPLDPALGKLYREKILKVGGSRDEAESLEVDRVPSSCAYAAERPFVGFPWATTQLGCIPETALRNGACSDMSYDLVTGLLRCGIFSFLDCYVLASIYIVPALEPRCIQLGSQRVYTYVTKY